MILTTTHTTNSMRSARRPAREVRRQRASVHAAQRRFASHCPSAPRQHDRTATDARVQRAESIAGHVLIAIRALLGLMFVSCGLAAICDVFPPSHAASAGKAYALGGALLVAGSALPLLKGVEVLVATMLDLYKALCAHTRD